MSLCLNLILFNVSLNRIKNRKKRVTLELQIVCQILTIVCAHRSAYTKSHRVQSSYSSRYFMKKSLSDEEKHTIIHTLIIIFFERTLKRHKSVSILSCYLLLYFFQLSLAWKQYVVVVLKPWLLFLEGVWGENQTTDEEQKLKVEKS